MINKDIVHAPDLFCLLPFFPQPLLNSAAVNFHEDILIYYKWYDWFTFNIQMSKVIKTYKKYFCILYEHCMIFETESDVTFLFRNGFSKFKPAYSYQLL